jgi:hypothetical protein
MTDVEFAFSQALAVARVLLSVIGWLAVFRGLVITGARPRAAVAAAFVLAGTAVWILAIQPSFHQLWISDQMLMSVTNMATIVVATLQPAVTGAVVAALLTGAFRGQRPRLGWRLGAAAAIAIAGASIVILAQVLLGPSTRPDGSQDYWAFTVSSVLDSASWLLLVHACLAGIGRGTEERHVTWPRRRVYVVTGDRRLRPAGG